MLARNQSSLKRIVYLISESLYLFFGLNEDMTENGNCPVGQSRGLRIGKFVTFGVVGA